MGTNRLGAAGKCRVVSLDEFWFSAHSLLPGDGESVGTQAAREHTHTHTHKRTHAHTLKGLHSWKDTKRECIHL